MLTYVDFILKLKRSKLKGMINLVEGNMRAYFDGVLVNIQDRYWITN